MDAVKYIREKARMCNSFNTCGKCPLYGIRSTDPVCDGDRPEESVSIVEQWSREHPAMNNAQKFEEVFGEKPSGMNGRICPPIAFRKSKSCNCKCSECDQWWDEPYKEPEGKK